MRTPIKAVTFDLWDTIIDDDSDEPKRLAQGLRPKPEERRHLLWEALNRHQEIALEDVNAAYAAADAAFKKAWMGHSITWKVADRLARVLMELDRTLPDAELGKLADEMGRMEVDLPPDLIDGIANALEVDPQTILEMLNSPDGQGELSRFLPPQRLGERHRLLKAYFALPEEIRSAFLNLIEGTAATS